MTLIYYGNSTEKQAERLAAYLHAAVRSAREHPYPGVLPGVMPPLATVYVELRAAEEDRRYPARHILEQAGTCLLAAGPGAGKSSLLRTLLATLGDGWLSGPGGNEIPILVSASALARAPLAQALAAAANTSLAEHGLVEPLTAGFFASPPKPGVRWLVLVDGLDEIPSLDVRAVIKAIGAVHGGAQSADYRFVVATRPLPDEDLRQLGEGMMRYNLLPLTADDVGAVARGWLGALGRPDPQHGVLQFTRAIEASGCADAARIPLMASMLCQLFAANPDQALPKGRGQIYDEFTALLRDRSRELRLTSLQAECEALARYSPAVVACARTVVDRLDELTAEIAHHVYSGIDISVSVLAQAVAIGKRPVGIPQPQWSTFLSTVLRVDGLLIDRAGRLEFLHQTLIEHLAARHATRDEAAVITILRDLPDLMRRSRTVLPPVANAQTSFFGFVLDAANAVAPEAWARCLEPPTRSPERLRGWIEFVAGQGHLGTYLSALTQSAARDAAQRLLADSRQHGRLSLVYALRSLGSPYGVEGLRALATDPDQDHEIRLAAVGALAERPDSGAANPLFALAADARLDSAMQGRAIDGLVQLRDPRATDLLYARASDADLDDEPRVEAARALAGLRDPRAADLLYALATHPDLEYRAERLAVEALVDVRSAEADALCRLVSDPRLMAAGRRQAANALAKLQDPRAADIWNEQATNADADAGVRRLATKALVELREIGTADRLFALATDSELDSAARWMAAFALQAFGDPRVADVQGIRSLTESLLRIAERDYLDHVEEWARLGDPLAAEVLYTVASGRHPATDHMDLTSALDALVECRTPLAVELLHDMATSPVHERLPAHPYTMRERPALPPGSSTETDEPSPPGVQSSSKPTVLGSTVEVVL